MRTILLFSVDIDCPILSVIFCSYSCTLPVLLLLFQSQLSIVMLYRVKFYNIIICSVNFCLCFIIFNLKYRYVQRRRAVEEREREQIMEQRKFEEGRRNRNIRVRHLLKKFKKVYNLFKNIIISHETACFGNHQM